MPSTAGSRVRARRCRRCDKRRWSSCCWPKAQVARFVRDKMTPAAAPEATKVPEKYPGARAGQRAAAQDQARSVGSLPRCRRTGRDARAADGRVRNHRGGAQRRHDGRRDARQHLQRARPAGDGVDRREFDQRAGVLAREAHGRQRRGLSGQDRDRARRADRAVRRRDPGRLGREHLQRRGRQHAGGVDRDLRLGRRGAGTHGRAGALDDDQRRLHLRGAAGDDQHQPQQRRRHPRRDGRVRSRQSIGVARDAAG